jgi:hypothetical protein
MGKEQREEGNLDIIYGIHCTDVGDYHCNPPYFSIAEFKNMLLFLKNSANLHTYVYCSTIHNSQVMETAKMTHH